MRFVPPRNPTQPPPGAKLLSSHRLAAGLRGFWLCNEDAGNLVTDRVRGARGLCAGHAWQGGALILDGNTSEVGVADVGGYYAPPALSLVARICVLTGWAQYDRLFNKRLEWYSTDGWHVAVYDNSGIEVGGSSSTTIIPTYNWLDNVPFTLGVSIDATGAARLYKDGLYIAGGSVTPIVPNAEPLYFGRYGNGGNTAPMSISWAGLWGRVLSDAEMLDMHRNPYRLFERPQRARMLFTAGGGATLVTITDAGTGTDDIAGILASLSIADTGTGADGLASLLASLQIADAGTGADDTTRSAQLAIADTGAGSEGLSQTGQLAVTDSGQGVEGLTVAALLLVADAGTGAETVSLQASLTIADAGAGADVLASLLASLQIADSGAGVEVVTVTDGAPSVVVVSDSGQGVDAIAGLLGSLLVADNATGAEALALVASLVVPESGSGLDAVAVGSALQVLDSALGTDAVAVATLVTITDSATGVETISLAGLLQVLEQALGVDQVIISGLSSGTVTVSFTLKKGGARFQIKKGGADFRMH